MQISINTKLAQNFFVGIVYHHPKANILKSLHTILTIVDKLDERKPVKKCIAKS